MQQQHNSNSSEQGLGVLHAACTAAGFKYGAILVPRIHVMHVEAALRAMLSPVSATKAAGSLQKHWSSSQRRPTHLEGQNKLSSR